VPARLERCGEATNPAESADPEVNISAVARRNGVSCRLLKVWRRKARRASSEGPQFVRQARRGHQNMPPPSDAPPFLLVEQKGHLRVDRLRVELRFGPLTGVNSMLTHQYRDKNLRNCEIVLQRGGYDVETLFWAGSMEEVRELAEEIAFRGGADTYRIVEFSGAGPGNDHLSAPASDPSSTVGPAK
jgi:transposase-like protein